MSGWNGSCEDWLHGDEHLTDEDEYPPMAQWEIDAALADIKAKDGTGLDIEFADSRPVWVYNAESEEITALPFKGTVILLPFLTITFGYVYITEETDYYE